MNTQQFPKNFTDLPVIHVYGSARFLGGRRLIIAGLFFVVLCVYYFPLSHSYYTYHSPTYAVAWDRVDYFMHADFWNFVLLCVVWLPWLCSASGFLMFLFPSNANKRTGWMLGIISLVSLEIWHLYEYWSYNQWYDRIFGGILEYWLLFFLFVLVTVLCWERRRKEVYEKHEGVS